MKKEKEIKEKIKKLEKWKEQEAKAGNTEAFDKWQVIINYLEWVLTN